MRGTLRLQQAAEIRNARARAFRLHPLPRKPHLRGRAGARAIATVPAADGGSYGALGGVLALPANILLGAVPFVDKIALAGLRKAAAESGVIYVDSFCAAKCAESATGRGSGSAHAGAYGRD